MGGEKKLLDSTKRRGYVVTLAKQRLDEFQSRTDIRKPVGR